MPKKSGKVFPNHVFRKHKQASGRTWGPEDMQTFALSPDDIMEVGALVDAIDDIRMTDGSSAIAKLLECAMEAAAMFEDLILSGRTKTIRQGK